MSGKIVDSLSKFIKDKTAGKEPIVCKVISLDYTNKNCYCQAIDNVADVQMVRYQPELSVDGFVIIPKVNSIVLVSFMNNGAAYISMFSEVEEIHLAGASYGGIVKVADLVTRLNNLENAFNTHLTKYNTHIHGGVTTGAGVSAVVTVLDTGTVTTTTAGMIESDTVYHGNNI